MILLVLAGVSTMEEEPSAFEAWVEDNPMLAGTIALVVLVVFGVAWTLAAMHRNQRTKAMAPTARKHKLQYAESDPFGSTKVAFPLFRAGDGRRVEHVMWRDGSNGTRVQVFDYGYYEEVRDQQNDVVQSWHYFTCALTRHNGLWSPIRIGPERTVDKVAQHIGLPDIELESEEFNRAFVIQCADRKFATDLLDPQMMEFLLTTGALMTFETKGRWLLVTTKRVEPPLMPGLLEVADAFVGRIPDVVWDLYPKAPDDDDLVPEEGLGFIPTVGRREPARDTVEEFTFAPDPVRSDPPAVEYDLDGHPVRRHEENPWV